MQKFIKQESLEAEPGKQITGQPSRLQTALAKLKDYQLSVNQVRRVAVEQQGTIHIEAHEAGKQRFFVYETDELCELKPENDLKIPLVSKLSEDGFADDYAIISYRPGRRIVLGPVDGKHDHIIKGYKKRRAAQAAEQYVMAASVCGKGGFKIPELLQYESDKDCLVMAKHSGCAPGITAETTDVWADIGSCLKHFQQSPLNDGLGQFTCQDELDVLDERARRFPYCVPDLPKGWQHGRSRLGTIAAILPPAIKGLAHRDLHDEQFIVAGQSITLLDFDLICISDVALDAGNLLAHMRLRALQKQNESGDPAVSACSKAFLKGLGRNNEPGFEQRLLYYQATTYYRLALLYALRPRWEHLTNTLIHEGKQCINAIDELRFGK